MTEQLAKVFQESLRHAEEAGDVEPLVALFAEDATLSNLATASQAGTPHAGRDGARQFWRDYLEVFEEIHSNFTRSVVSPDTVALEWESKGQLKTGKPLTYRGVSILETRGDKVQHFRTYYDTAPFISVGP